MVGEHRQGVKRPLKEAGQPVAVGSVEQCALICNCAEAVAPSGDIDQAFGKAQVVMEVKRQVQEQPARREHVDAQFSVKSV